MPLLVGGRGQLGDLLKQKIKQLPQDIIIYHTWQVADKSEPTQISEYEKFQRFVDQNSEKNIVFISSKSQRNTWYSHYKQLSEAYLLTKCQKGIVIRLPTFIGKPSKLFETDKDIETYGEIELISVEGAANKIIEICNSKTLLKCFDIEGEVVSATLVRRIVEAVS